MRTGPKLLGGRIEIADGLREPAEMMPEIVLGDVAVPVPAMSRPGRSREERGEQHIVQDDARPILRVELEGTAVARLDRPALGQQDRLAQLESDQGRHGIGSQHVHRPVTDSQCGPQSRYRCTWAMSLPGMKHRDRYDLAPCALTSKLPWLCVARFFGNCRCKASSMICVHCRATPEPLPHLDRPEVLHRIELVPELPGKYRGIVAVAFGVPCDLRLELLSARRDWRKNPRCPWRARLATRDGWAWPPTSACRRRDDGNAPGSSSRGCRTCGPSRARRRCVWPSARRTRRFWRARRRRTRC